MELPLRLLVSAEAVAVEQFAFYCGEETLAHRIVEAVSDRSCGGTNTGLLAAQAKGERGILRSLVGVMDHVLWTTLLDKSLLRYLIIREMIKQLNQRYSLSVRPSWSFVFHDNPPVISTA